MEIRDRKAAQRRAGIMARRGLPQAERAAANAAICARLLAMSCFQKAENLLLYAAFGGEVDLAGLAEQAARLGKTVAYPVCGENFTLTAAVPGPDGWEVGAYGIRTPVLERAALIRPEALDLVLVPCTAFDAVCRRVGMGKGYYDRYLPRCRNAVALGVAFEAQRVPEAAADEQDWQLEEVAREADILTFHTPLDASTRHMADSRLFGLMKPGAILINSSRGEVVDGEALLRSGLGWALDVWEHEPHLDPALLENALLATPHIAGYSEQGKANATAMSVASLARRFGLPLEGWYPPQAAPARRRPISWQELCRTIGGAYDIASESRSLKERPGDFESMRDHYAYRREYF